MAPRTRRFPRAGRVGVLTGMVVLVCVLQGCQSAGRPNQAKRVKVISADLVDPIALQAEVNAFATSFRARLSGVTSEISRASASRIARESALRWKIQVIPAIDEAEQDPDPRIALADIWAICVRQKAILDGPLGEQAFGDQTGAARRVADELVRQIVELAGQYLPPDRIAEISAAMERYAAAPVINEFRLGRSVATSGKTAGNDPLRPLLTLPLAPLNAVGAIGDTPHEIHNLAIIGNGFIDTARDLPEQMRWQMELLLLETEDNPLLQSVDRLSAAAESAARTAADLQAALDRANGPLSEIHQSLQEANTLAVQVDATVGRAERITASIGPQAEAVSRAAAAAESTVRAVHELLDAWTAAHPDQPGASQGPPLDIKEVAAAAERTRDALVEARGLLSDLQSANLKSQLDEIAVASRGSVDRAEARLRALIVTLAWSLGAVIGLGIIASTVSRLLVHRLTRPAAPAR